MARGTGKTTEQMQSAPQGAVFVWCNGDTGYAKGLAKKIAREDLEIVAPRWLEDERWRGIWLKGLVIDHDSALTERQQYGFEHACARVLRPNA